LANVFGRLERILEDAVEGTSRRLFRTRLQPVQLAKAASRAMQEQQVVGPDGPEVPNKYLISLHPSDFAQFASYQRSLEVRIERYLDQFAADRGLRPVASWRVEIQVDETVRPRGVGVEAHMADVEDAPPERTRVAEVPMAGTAPMPRVAASTGRAVGARLEAEDGRQFGLTRETTSLGRALDNDVVISDSRVSRYHAQIQRTGSVYLVRDLGSTNGTAVAGKRVAERRLGDGDEFSLGGFRIVVRLVDR